MGRKQTYQVILSKTDREYLETYLRAGIHSTRLLNRVRVLLLADKSEFGQGWTDDKIVEAVGVSRFTVWNLRKGYCKNGLEATIRRKSYDTSNRERKLDGKAEAKMIAMLMGDPPEGHAKWSLRLIADKMVELDIVDEISHEGVRLYLKKIGLNPGTRNRG